MASLDRIGNGTGTDCDRDRVQQQQQQQQLPELLQSITIPTQTQPRPSPPPPPTPRGRVDGGTGTRIGTGTGEGEGGEEGAVAAVVAVGGGGKGAESATAQCSPQDLGAKEAEGATPQCALQDLEKSEMDMGMEETTAGNNHVSHPRPLRNTHDTPDFAEKDDGDRECPQQQRPRRHNHARRSRRTNSDNFYDDNRLGIDVEQQAGSREETDHRHKSSYVWRVLCYLTFIAPFLSVLCALYTLITLLLLIISYPLQNLTSSTCPPFGTTVISRLLPPLELHMRFLYWRRHPFPTADDVGAARLVRVHMLSPLVAIPIGAVAAFISFVWLYTEVLLGDKNDEKGMEYRGFLWVKQRWENFVLSSLKSKELPEGGDSFREG